MVESRSLNGPLPGRTSRWGTRAPWPRRPATAAPPTAPPSTAPLSAPSPWPRRTASAAPTDGNSARAETSWSRRCRGRRAAPSAPSWPSRSSPRPLWTASSFLPPPCEDAAAIEGLPPPSLVLIRLLLSGFARSKVRSFCPSVCLTPSPSFLWLKTLDRVRKWMHLERDSRKWSLYILPFYNNSPYVFVSTGTVYRIVEANKNYYYKITMNGFPQKLQRICKCVLPKLFSQLLKRWLICRVQIIFQIPQNMTFSSLKHWMSAKILFLDCRSTLLSGYLVNFPLFAGYPSCLLPFLSELSALSQ